MDALKRTLGFSGNGTSQSFQPTSVVTPRLSFPMPEGNLDSISASMVVVEEPPSLDQRGAGGCIEYNNVREWDSTASPGKNSVSSTEDAAAATPPMKERLVSMWNNMKFSKTIWTLDSKTSNAFSSSNTSGFSNNFPVWIMGQCYHNYRRSGLSRQSSYDSNPDKNSDFKKQGIEIECSASGIDALTADFHSKIWMTYRKDFDIFKGTHTDTDCGWGCMIR